MVRRHLAGAGLALAISGISAGALAGGYVTLGCGDWRQEFMVGTGRDFRGQGLELWPMVCLSTGKLSSYARVMDARRFAGLETLAAQNAADSMRLADWMTAHADLARQIVAPDMFGQIEGMTFGDVRSAVANAARPTEETILASRFVYYVHPTCTGRLVPFDYYVERQEPCPACDGARLRVLDTGNHAEWD